MKELIYKFLDKNYPINNNIINACFNENINAIINNVFGVNNITFHDWIYDRVGKVYAIMESDNSILWYKGKLVHRDNDLPALICENGTKVWYKNNKRHRNNNKPAVIYTNGDCAFFNEGVLYKTKINNKEYVL